RLGEVSDGVILTDICYLQRQGVKQHLHLFSGKTAGWQHDLAIMSDGRFGRHHGAEAYLSMVRHEGTAADVIELTADLVPLKGVKHIDRLWEQNMVLLVEVRVEQ